MTQDDDLTNKPVAKDYGGHRVSVDLGALRMVLNALQRDVSEGRVVRGEMAEALESSIRQDVPEDTPKQRHRP